MTLTVWSVYWWEGNLNIIHSILLPLQDIHMNHNLCFDMKPWKEKRPQVIIPFCRSILMWFRSNAGKETADDVSLLSRWLIIYLKTLQWQTISNKAQNSRRNTWLKTLNNNITLQISSLYLSLARAFWCFAHSRRTLKQNQLTLAALDANIFRQKKKLMHKNKKKKKTKIEIKSINFGK